MGVLDTLNAATPSRRTVTMCLDGALQAELDEVEASFQAAVDQDTARPGSLANPTPALNGALRRHEHLRARLADSEVTFTFERMPPWEHVTLQAEHPPRPGNLADNSRGHNIETFVPARIRRSCVSVVDAGGDTKTRDEIPDDTWDTLLGVPEGTVDKDGKPRTPRPGSLSLGQLDRLAGAARAVNERIPDVPPSARSLLVSQDSGTSSAPPSPGPVPPRSAGKAGNRPTAAKSSAGRKPTAKKAAAKKATSARSRAS